MISAVGMILGVPGIQGRTMVEVMMGVTAAGTVMVVVGIDP